MSDVKTTASSQPNNFMTVFLTASPLHPPSASILFSYGDLYLMDLAISSVPMLSWMFIRWTFIYIRSLKVSTTRCNPSTLQKVLTQL